MKIGLGISMSREVNSDLAVNISNELEDFFSNRNYGLGIMDIAIGLICVSENYEEFFKPPKPKYTKEKKEKEIEGFKWVIEKLLEYPCKIDFNSYQKLDVVGRKELIAKEILNTSKEVFEKKKIKEFDENSFLEDLQLFFEKQGYI